MATGLSVGKPTDVDDLGSIDDLGDDPGRRLAEDEPRHNYGTNTLVIDNAANGLDAHHRAVEKLLDVAEHGSVRCLDVGKKARPFVGCPLGRKQLLVDRHQGREDNDRDNETNEKALHRLKLLRRAAVPTARTIWPESRVPLIQVIAVVMWIMFPARIEPRIMVSPSMKRPFTHAGAGVNLSRGRAARLFRTHTAPHPMAQVKTVEETVSARTA